MAKRAAWILGAVALLYAARRYYRNWGTTKEECRLRLAGDELVGRPAVQTTEGVSVDAPAELVWTCLAQLVPDRQGPDLAPGDVIGLTPKGRLGLRRGITLTVTQVVERQSVVLTGKPPAFPWDAVWSFHLLPRGDDRCRLLLRTRAHLRHPGEVFGVELAGPANALVTRRLLLGIKHSAENRLSSSAADSSARQGQHFVESRDQAAVENLEVGNRGGVG